MTALIAIKNGARFARISLTERRARKMPQHHQTPLEVIRGYPVRHEQYWQTATQRAETRSSIKRLPVKLIQPFLCIR